MRARTWGASKAAMGETIEADAFVTGSELASLVAANVFDSYDLVAEVPVRRLLTGEPLFLHGDLKTHLYQIVAGIIGNYFTHLDPSHVVVEYAFPGDVLGFGYLKHHIFDARALIATRVRCLPLSAVDNIVDNDDRARRRCTEATSREFAYRRDQLVDANRSNPTARVAAFLLVISQINDHGGRDPRIVTDALNCHVVTDWLRLDLKSLERSLVELRMKGLIEPCPPHGLRLINVEGLSSVADNTQLHH